MADRNMADEYVVVEVEDRRSSEEKMMERLMLYTQYMQHWTQLVKPDMKQMADLIVRAKGPDRTMAEFADAVGTSASTLSRAVNLKATRPISYDILVGIAENAEEGSGIDLEGLLYADGYRKKREREVSGDNEIPDKMKRRNDIVSVLQGRLLATGAQVALDKCYVEAEPELDKYFFDYGYPSHGETIFKTDLFEGSTHWVVYPCSYVSLKEDESDAVERIDFLLKQVSDVLMIDRWRPEQLAGVRFTFAIADEVIYRHFLRAMRDLKAEFNNCFTVMLVDIDKTEIVEETVLPCTKGTSRAWNEICDNRTKE